MKRDQYDAAYNEALDQFPEGNSDYGTYRDGASGAGEPNWSMMLVRRSRYGQYRRRLRRLASRRRDRRRESTMSDEPTLSGEADQ